MKIFDTLSEKQVQIEKSKKNLNVFVCGLTVYDKSHIGHARTYLVFDALVKYIRSTGQKVFYLQNVTDVDDKIIQRAKENKISPFALSKKFEKNYHEIEKKLNITSVTKYARASEHIKEIIKQIMTLINKGFAYESPNGVYFRVRKFLDYGKLSRQNLDDLRSGWRIDVDDKKEDPLDFALWKKINYKKTTTKKEPIIIDGEPGWKSPWGLGRPGWHIEDTAITEKYFGSQYDIHGGGADLKFPHHESEIAQQESASGKKPFVKIWIHTGFLLINGEKMSKSLNNFVTIEDFLKKYSPNTLRLMILSHSIKSPFDYTDESAMATEKTFSSIKNALEKLDFVLKNRKRKIEKETIEIEEFENNFIEALENDFNTPKALAVVFELINFIQKKIYFLPNKEIVKIKKTIIKMLSILGFVMPKNEIISGKIQTMVKKRDLAKSNKQFIQSDALRNKINQLGYNIEDTPIGSFVYKKD